MPVSDQLQTPITLLPEKKPLVSTGSEVTEFHSVWMWNEREESMSLTGFIPGCSALRDSNY
jgi:hypothetical protein